MSEKEQIINPEHVITLVPATSAERAERAAFNRARNELASEREEKCKPVRFVRYEKGKD